jgi:hypothetical protein
MVQNIERLNNEIQTHKTICAIEERRSAKLECQLQAYKGRVDTLEEEVNVSKDGDENPASVYQ